MLTTCLLNLPAMHTHKKRSPNFRKWAGMPYIASKCIEIISKNAGSAFVWSFQPASNKSWLGSFFCLRRNAHTKSSQPGRQDYNRLLDKLSFLCSVLIFFRILSFFGLRTLNRASENLGQGHYIGPPTVWVFWLELLWVFSKSWVFWSQFFSRWWKKKPGLKWTCCHSTSVILR